jgi:conjugative transposon TraN protein
MNRYSALLLSIIFSNGIMAQSDSIPSMPLSIAYNKTTSLVFPLMIKTVDMGSKDLLVQKARGVENVLQVKAGKENFIETNMTVITADGKLYSFVVNYAADPSSLNVQLDNTPTLFEKIAGQKRSVFGIRDKKYEMSLGLLGLYIEKGIIYYQLELQNRSNISYDIDMLRFFIKDKSQSKRTASQELEQFPLSVYGNTGFVAGKSKQTIVVALSKFTIPDKKFLYIQLMEKNGGRHLLLKVKNRDIIKAKRIQAI